MTTAKFTHTNLTARLTAKKMDVALNLSEETTAFTADIYMDGKRIGSAQNDGHGGNTFLYINTPHNFTDIQMEQIEIWIDEQAANAENAKREKQDEAKIARWIKKQLAADFVVWLSNGNWVANRVARKSRDAAKAMAVVLIDQPTATNFKFPTDYTNTNPTREELETWKVKIVEARKVQSKTHSI